MMFTNVAAIAALTSIASASPAMLESRSFPRPGHHYVAPKPSDSRGPCPALNALANHGFLPHNGEGITVGMYVKACAEGLHTGPSFALPQGELAMQSNCTTATQMSLRQLGNHNKFIEHDASLAHQDAYFGKDYVRVAKDISQFLGGFPKGAKKTTLKTAAAAKYQRTKDSKKNNPDLNYGPRELLFSYIESALYLQTMGRSLTSGVAELSYVKALFVDERLPYAEGWTPGPIVNEGSLGGMAVLLQPLAPAPGDEETYVVTAGAIKEIIEAKSDLIFEGKKGAVCPGPTFE